MPLARDSIAAGAPPLVAASWPALPDPERGTGGGFGLFAYLFYRPDAAPGAAFTTYGGSQWFARAQYRFGGEGVVGRSNVYVRASGPMDGGGQAEVALGGAMQPLAGLPITLHAERRFRPHAPDASAAFISGGLSDVALPRGAALNAYAQGGGIWPDRGAGTAFFDGQAAVTAPLHRSAHGQSVHWRADAGVLAAAGGQSGPDATARLDLGPVVTVKAGKGAQVEAQLGWRFRVAGDAAPAHGPAVTLSVGF